MAFAGESQGAIYGRADVALLARVDQVRELLNGPATQHVFERGFEVYGKPEYERLTRTS